MKDNNKNIKTNKRDISTLDYTGEEIALLNKMSEVEQIDYIGRKILKKYIKAFKELSK